jgi:hypothetical protein
MDAGVLDLPDLPPGGEFRGTDSIAGEIAFMQANELRFGQLGETPAAAGIDLFLRPSGYSRCCIACSNGSVIAAAVTKSRRKNGP